MEGCVAFVEVAEPLWTLVVLGGIGLLRALKR